MANFERAIQIIFDNEGDYSNDELDAGGQTKYGISKRSYPHLNIPRLTKQQAASIYFKDYWLRLGCDKIIDDNIALQLFDFGVNAGVSRSAKLMQVIVGAKRDGIIGPKSLVLINALFMPRVVVDRFVHQRVLFYVRLVKRNPGQIAFLKGWVNRAFKTRL